MRRWQKARPWLRGLLWIGILVALAGCPGPGGDECGGAEALASCVTITSIQPTSTAGGDSSDVDVVFTADCDGDPATVDPEPFTRHDATITFSNDTFPTATGSLSVTLRRMTVTYSLVSCPTGAVCPPLTGFTENLSFSIPEDSSTSDTFSFVPIQVKNEFVNEGGSANAFPVYQANYAFTAETNFFEDSFTVAGSASFVLGNFDSCP